MMENWKKALSKFLKSWIKNKDVIGVLVCGSYVTGNPTKYSDIDVHIILNDKVDWRERGNKIVDGFLIEYFANPPKQIKEYFKENFSKNSTMSLVQFLTGEIIYEVDDCIADLQKEARIWFNKKFKRYNGYILKLNKYGLWDMLDNLEDAYHTRDPSFEHIYHNSLNQMLEIYCKFLGEEKISYHKSYSMLNSQKTRDRYLREKFKDDIFTKLYSKAMLEKNKKQMLNYYRDLTFHVFKKSGGFDIDGWKLRSKVICPK